MKEMLGKLYPIILPPLCIAIGVVGIVFFFVGPVGKEDYSILALGIIGLTLGIIQIILIIIEAIKRKKQ